ncbi:hypothetical protein [Qipengyuania polymorpha]|nr:hypothetical protein [Qipengyuania polymorpha]
MYQIFQIAFELFDWKKQSNFERTLSVMTVLVVIFGVVKLAFS